MAMQEVNDKLYTVDYCIIPLAENAYTIAFKLMTELRRKNYICEMVYEPKSIKSALRFANKIQSKKALIIGEEELANDSLSIKDMESGSQTMEKIEFFLKGI